jgi:entericidin A
MVFPTSFRKLNLALTAIVLLGGGVLLSACDTVAGAGHDISNVGYDVSGGAHSVQRDTHTP